MLYIIWSLKLLNFLNFVICFNCWIWALTDPLIWFLLILSHSKLILYWQLLLHLHSNLWVAFFVGLAIGYSWLSCVQLLFHWRNACACHKIPFWMKQHQRMPHLGHACTCSAHANHYLCQKCCATLVSIFFCQIVDVKARKFHTHFVINFCLSECDNGKVL